MARETFSIAWWNTSLAPGAQSRASTAQRDIACAVNDLMTQTLQKDLNGV